MHTNTFGLKFVSLSPAVALKIRSRSPKPNQPFIMSQCYIHANLVKIHPPVHEISCKKESVTPMLTPMLTPTPTGSAPKTMSPSPLVGDILTTYVTETHYEKICFKPYPNNRDADQTAHLHSLISASVVHCLDSIIPTLAKSKISRF